MLMGHLLGVHSLSLERETSTGVLANFSPELAKFYREFAKLVEAALTNFAQETTGINLQF